MGNLIKGLERTIRIVFLMAAVMGMAASAKAAAQDADSKAVRIGWYESTFLSFDYRRNEDHFYIYGIDYLHPFLAHYIHHN